MMDRNKLKRLLSIRLANRLTNEQIERFVDWLIEVEQPSQDGVEKISKEITGSRLIIEALDIDDIITILDQARQ